MLPHLQKILLKIFGFILKCWVCGSLKKPLILTTRPLITFISATKTESRARSLHFFLFRKPPGNRGKRAGRKNLFLRAERSTRVWKRRLEENGLSVKEQIMLSEQVLLFNDTEDLPLAIMEDERSGQSEWTPSGITEKEAITGMRGVLLYSYRPEATIQFLIETLRLFKDRRRKSNCQAAIGGKDRTYYRC